MSQRGKKQGPGAGNTVAVCTRLAQPVAEELGLQLWDVRFVKEGADWYLRFFIDREGGVTIDDCEEMSRRMDKLLDEADPIACSYCLEVSSPGVERELCRPEHFEQFLGWPVKVRTIRPVDGVREFVGLLERWDGETASLEIEEEDGCRHVFSRKDVASVHLTEEWEDVPEEDA